MNCPSRTDDVDLNPGWNQNPPFLAADLTTCEDLNGMINARELKRDSRAGSHPTAVSVEDEHLTTSSKMRPVTPRSTVGGWALWLLSVLLTAFILSNLNVFRLSNVKALVHVLQKDSMAQSHTRLPKRASCAKGGVNQAEYNMPMHVGALFIILFVSATGCAFPMLVLKFPKLRVPASFLFTARHFGTGVLIATAFVHLLPTAFLSLSDPCLSSFWTEQYPAMPGAIALAAVFMLTVIEMSFSPGRTLCSGGHGDVESVSRGTQVDDISAPHAEHPTRPSQPRPPLAIVVEGSSPLRDKGPLFGRSSSFSRTLARLGEESRKLDQVELTQLREHSKKLNSDETLESLDNPEASSQSSHHLEEPSHAHKRAVLQVMLLEMGILFHSIFIGMSLSVSVGSDFIVLLVAIIFHQTFEGLALGARIASIKWPNNTSQPWVMAFAYGCTTPIGQAVGLATHTLYSPDSEVGLLVVGIMNAISAGLLIFASLVELLSEDFLSDESWRVLRGKRRVWACVLVFLGAFLMSLVGAWA